MATVDWVVKVSKLCNLRCRYCYEWDNLANPARMSLDTWSGLLGVAREFHLGRAAQAAPEVFSTRFVWHGGEPLLLPRHYFEAVINLQKNIFGADAIDQGTLRNALQTNLYAPDFSLIEYLRDQGFAFGVSCDYVPGLRRAITGADSHSQVLGNLDHLAELGIKTGQIVVLAGHNVDHVESIYRQARDVARRIRLLPLAEENGAPEVSQYACPTTTLVDALARVFCLWFDDGCPISIEPLDECLRIVTMKWLGLEQAEYDRAERGDDVLVVEPDGALRQICEPSDGCDVLGNVRWQSWGEIRGSAAYGASLVRDRQIRAMSCQDCAYRGACDGYPVLSFNVAAAKRGECAVFKPLLARIETELRVAGVTPADMLKLLNELV